MRLTFYSAISIAYPIDPFHAIGFFLYALLYRKASFLMSEVATGGVT